jgi:spermidine synthase
VATLALLWEKHHQGNHYQVKSAGRTIRLYTNGVFHSQFNTRRPFSGQVWDLLSLPVFFHRSFQAKRILVLGLGGGAVVKQLEHLLKPQLITAIELDPIHIYIAQHFFHLQSSTSDVIEADAVQWVNNYQGEKFDLIIDDLFADDDQQPVRAIEADVGWMQKLDKLLSKDGILVCNFPEREDLMHCGIIQNSKLQHGYASIFQLSTPLTYNRVGVFLRQPATSRQLRNHIRQSPLLKLSELRYSIRQIK